MNIFRSEDDAKAWDLYNPASETAIRSVAEYFALLNTDLFSQRLTPDYLARIPEYSAEAFGAIAAMGDDPFWELPPIE